MTCATSAAAEAAAGDAQFGVGMCHRRLPRQAPERGSIVSFQKRISMKMKLSSGGDCSHCAHALLCSVPTFEASNTTLIRLLRWVATSGCSRHLLFGGALWLSSFFRRRPTAIITPSLFGRYSSLRLCCKPIRAVSGICIYTSKRRFCSLPGHAVVQATNLWPLA